MADRTWFEEGDPYSDPDRYECTRYHGLYGRFREWRERQLLDAFFERTRPAQSVLDCPAGVGRLFSAFRDHELRVVGADLSREMLRFAQAEEGSSVVGLIQSRAGELALEEDAVDWVFSFALMKHLSPDAQMATLREFCRIARRGVVVSLAILDPISFPRWWLRHRGSTEPSFPIPQLWLRLAADRIGLQMRRLGRVVPPLGLETLYMLTPLEPNV